MENLSGDPLILHDGPPYANGDLHMGKRTPLAERARQLGWRLMVGHALNKILKDIILRYNILQGRRVSYIPGWDCHGLPIELKAVKGSSRKKLSAPTIRSIARTFAEKTVQKQLEEFKSWGVTGDWQNRWLTMDRDYEVRQLQVFLEMVKKGMERIAALVAGVYIAPGRRAFHERENREIR